MPAVVMSRSAASGIDGWKEDLRDGIIQQMKHGHLCSIGHNLADSLASGMCFVIGVWSTDVFGEAAAGEGLIEVDFLGGQIVRGTCSENLRSAVKRFAEVLPEFCCANGADVGDFAALTATFHAATLDRRVSLDITDRNGQNSVTQYAGLPLKRLRILDGLGRIRRSPRLRMTSRDNRRPAGEIQPGSDGEEWGDCRRLYRRMHCSPFAAPMSPPARRGDGQRSPSGFCETC